MKTLFRVSPDTIHRRVQAKMVFGDNFVIFLYDKYGKPTVYVANETFTGYSRGSRVGILYHVVYTSHGTQQDMNGLYNWLFNTIEIGSHYSLSTHERWYNHSIDLEVLVSIVKGYVGK